MRSSGRRPIQNQESEKNEIHRFHVKQHLFQRINLCKLKSETKSLNHLQFLYKPLVREHTENNISG